MVTIIQLDLSCIQLVSSGRGPYFLVQPVAYAFPDANLFMVIDGIRWIACYCFSTLFTCMFRYLFGALDIDPQAPILIFIALDVRGTNRNLVLNNRHQVG